MKTDLPILQYNTMEILKELEYTLDIGNHTNETKFPITFRDINFKKFNRITDLYAVTDYLKEKGLDITITFDLVNEYPASYIDEDHQTAEDVEVGYIKSNGLQELKTQISNFKNELVKVSQKSTRDLEIKLSIDNHELIVGKDTITWDSSSLEWSLFYVLIENNRETSWDEIMEHYTGDRPKTEKIQKKKVGDARDRINRKVIRESRLNEGLIKRKKHQYRFSRKVIKSD